MPSARWFSWASVLKMGIIKVTGNPIKDIRSKGVLILFLNIQSKKDEYAKTNNSMEYQTFLLKFSLALYDQTFLS